METKKPELPENAIDSGVDLMKLLAEQIQIVSAFYGDNPTEQLPNLCLAVISEEDKRLGLVPWGDYEEKEEVIKGIRWGLKQMNAIAYCFTSESWVVKTKSLDALNLLLPPSQNPDRTEAVLFTVATKTDALTAIFDIKRDKDGRVVELRETQPVKRSIAGQGGRLSSLLMDQDKIDFREFTSRADSSGGAPTLH